MPRVGILGAGMAGLLAAKALDFLGIKDFMLYDRTCGIQKLNGLHYLHDSCGLHLPKHIVHNFVLPCKSTTNLADEYARKIFGDNPPPTNSMQSLNAYETVYDMRTAYALLHSQYRSRINCIELSRGYVEKLSQTCDYIVSTIPSKVLFKGDYPMELVLVKNGLPAEARKLSSLELFYNFTLYNVCSDVNWYRASRVFGVECTEVKENGDYSVMKIKDGSFHVDLPNVLLAGRYAKWKRGYLAHQAYYEVLEHFSSI